MPDVSQLSRFKHNFCDYIIDLFNNLVSVTEPICREIDSKKADYLIYDTTGFEPYVAENNPKFFNSKLKEAKKFAKNSSFNPYAGVYKTLPDFASSNPSAKQQYINGHYCYAVKAGIATDGLGIVRYISVFDDPFKEKHPETVTPKSDDPNSDKEIGDSVSLKPVLSDFFSRHPDYSFKTFIGDSAFDSYGNYSLLKNTFGFERVCIPINQRNCKHSDLNFDKYGTPLCPLDNTPFIFLGKSGGKQRSVRFKWVCHKSVQNGSTRVCTCDNPCTSSSYGKCTYTYPDKDFCLYPGIPRHTEHWDNLYRHRVLIERTINLLKDSFGLNYLKTHDTKTIKADVFLAGITQLLGVILAKAVHKPKLFKSIHKLIASTA